MDPIMMDEPEPVEAFLVSRGEEQHDIAEDGQCDTENSRESDIEPSLATGAADGGRSDEVTPQNDTGGRSVLEHISASIRTFYKAQARCEIQKNSFDVMKEQLLESRCKCEGNHGAGGRSHVFMMSRPP